MKKLFHELIWPATAGNVAWSLFTLLITPPMVGADWAARTAVLLLLSIYLAYDWLRTHDATDQTAWYWLFDGAHIATIVAFVIGAASTRSLLWLEVSLGLVFAVTTAGHWFGAFGDPRKGLLGSANALGVVTLLVPVLLEWHRESGWQLPAAVAIVLVAWSCVRKFVPK